MKAYRGECGVTHINRAFYLEQIPRAGWFCRKIPKGMTRFQYRVNDSNISIAKSLAKRFRHGIVSLLKSHSLAYAKIGIHRGTPAAPRIGRHWPPKPRTTAKLTRSIAWYFNLLAEQTLSNSEISFFTCILGQPWCQPTDSRLASWKTWN